MRWSLVRRILIGMVCGAGVAVVLSYTAFGGPQGPVEEATWFLSLVEFAGIVAVLGGIAGGVLRPSGWAMFAGGIVGAIVVGLLGVVVTRHLLGLSYSLVGAPLGALLVFLVGIRREAGKPVVPAAADGVWDKEFDT